MYSFQDKTTKKIILLCMLIISIFLVYKSEFLLFNMLEKVDNATNHKFKLVGIRNKFLHGLNSLNPFIGKSSLDNMESLKTININIDQSSMLKLNKSYNSILDDLENTDYTHISKDLNPYLKCKIVFNDEEYNAKIKFHGTATGHIIHSKKSFGIKLNKTKLLDGMRKFSLVIPEKQTPVAFIFEYELIKWLTGITTHAELVRIKINNIDTGIYSLEEKLAKELLEKNNLSGVDIIKNKNESGNQYSQGHLFSREASYQDFKNNSKKDLGQYLQWKKLYIDNKFNNIKHLLNLDNFAKNDALRALVFDLHGYINNNQKLLYNTSTGKFSPFPRYESRIKQVVLDHNSKYCFDKALAGVGIFENINPLLKKMIVDNSYRTKRNKFLYKVIQNKKLILKMYDDIYKKNIPIIYADNTNQAPGQQFEYIAKEKRKILVKNFNIIEKYLNYSKVYSELYKINNSKYLLEINPDCNVPVVVSNLTFKLNNGEEFYIKDVQNNEIKKIKNTLEINIFFRKKFLMHSLDNNLNIKKNTYKYEIYSNLDLNISDYDITYKNYIMNKNVIKRNTYKLFVNKPINYYNKDTKVLPVNEFLFNNKLPFKQKEKDLILSSDEYTINNNVVLPYGYNLIIKQGTKIKIAPEKSILVYGGIKIEGTKEKPVIVENLVKNKPFGVIGAIGDNKTNIDINHLNLSGGKAAIINGAFLSGGLSLYSHKKVKIKNSYIHHNSADDGLNIKNAEILLENNIFNANLADQVDLDFCTGYVENNKFIEKSLIKDYDNVQIPQDDNGDGLDFSGSKIIVKNNYYNGFLDKGISVGENTKALIINNKFKNNRSAITAKDQSDIYMSSNKYEDNKINVEMYQKKQIFKHPSVYNINEKHLKNKIKKTKESHYYKTKDSVEFKDMNISTVFNDLKERNWVEYE